eukprot:11211290-Ditylum_brightwellii.AAC.1
MISNQNNLPPPSESASRTELLAKKESSAKNGNKNAKSSIPKSSPIKEIFYDEDIFSSGEEDSNNPTQNDIIDVISSRKSEINGKVREKLRHNILLKPTVLSSTFNQKDVGFSKGLLK